MGSAGEAHALPLLPSLQRWHGRSVAAGAAQAGRQGAESAARTLQSYTLEERRDECLALWLQEVKQCPAAVSTHLPCRRICVTDWALLAGAGFVCRD